VSDTGALKDLQTFGRYARGLGPFLRSTVTRDEARRRVEEQLARRTDTFLDVLARGVYANADSPYLPLLRAAGAELGDVRAAVARAGLEGALAELHAAGVRVTLDEFKGRRPIERPGISAPGGPARFDNPLNARHFRASSSGSRGSPRRVTVDLDMLEHEAAYHSLFRTTFGLWDRPFGVWRVVPPNASAINNVLRQAKVGGTVARWFNPYRAPLDAESLKFAFFTRYTVLAARRAGSPLPFPEYVPPDDPLPVARWLAECAARGEPAVLDTQVSLGVRACLAAQAEGLDISGTLFRFGGEPYTAAKADVVARTGARAVCHYTMSEVGRIGMACGEGNARDDVHFLADKLAVLRHEKTLSGGASVGALSYTSLLPSAPKVLINVESDDYGTMDERSCGCPFGALGLTLHIHGIRSYEKLTAEGNHFLGSDLFALVDEVLPARFGGGPADYQLVEEEVGGLPKVSVVVRPSVGAMSEQEVVGTVVDFLRATPRNRLMANVWAQSDTLRLVRTEPRQSHPGGKILPLHTARPG
jgi:hypothetical protein